MNCKFVENYYIGLDIGTDSLGIAVTDENYTVPNFHGKAMWTTHLFECGNTAEERRMFRTARRRTDRKSQRLKLLKELFAEELYKTDPGFLQRLNDSKYLECDKSEQQKNTLFFEEDYDDQTFHSEYPTVYHLRKALIHNDRKYDLRLVYLSVAHIIKNRGHFLFEGQDLASATSFAVVFEDLLTTIRDYNSTADEENNIELNTTAYDEISDILKNPRIGIKNKKKMLYDLMGCKTKQSKAVADILTGAKVSFSALFCDETLNDAEVTKVSFSEDFSDKLGDIEKALGGDRMYMFEKLKAVYDWAVLADILNGNEFISDTKVEIYEKHKKDLAILKDAVRKYAPKKYNEVFRSNDEKFNYCAYSGHPSGKNGVLTTGICNKEDFGKYILKILKDMPDEYEYSEYIKNEIAGNTFLPKQTTKDNSVIPYQLNLYELKTILENQRKYHVFLNEKDSSGISLCDKIISILTFKIPYYVGPLNAHSKNAWIVKKENKKIYPWNFADVVDEQASAEAFINRMTNCCTYLVGEDVLPKDSVVYSKFVIYNQLNNITVDGEKLTVDIKNKMFNDLFIRKSGNVTSKKIIQFLKSNGYIDNKSEPVIGGIDNGVVGTMKSYHDFYKKIGSKASDLKMVDDIIAKIVVLPGTEKMLRAAIRNSWGSVLTDEEITELAKLKYSGWGRLSQKFLTGIYDVDKETGEAISILQAMERTNCNLMQLLSYEYGFTKAIEDYNNDINDITNYNGSYNAVSELAVSPAVKRGIWRTMQAVKEYVGIMGKDPAKIFIEMARGATEDQKNKRTVSRKQQILDLYKQCGKDCAALARSADATPEEKFRSDKLFLYYRQLGRSMYTGKPIDLDQLFNDNIYDIDHIYPQSKIKDDSLDNRVLVEKELNGKKSDTYPLPSFCKTPEAKALWKILKDKQLISEEKYKRLTRTTPFTESELAAFISRQLVETRQSTKAVAELFKKMYPDTEIVYVKAGNVADFKQEYDIIKCRSVNDFHHAKDAYLNIVVGNVYHCKFTNNPANYIRNNPSYSMNRVFSYPVKSHGKLVWDPENNNTLNHVKKQVSKNNINFTRYAYCQSGGFFDQMPVKKGSGQYPLKTSDERLTIENYGGYNKISGAYFMLLDHELKGKPVRTIEFVPVYLASRIENDPSVLDEYVAKNYTNAKILIRKIKINTLFKVNGFPMHISGRTGAQIILKNAVQLILSDKSYSIAKKITNFVEKNREEKDKKVSPLSKISKEDNLHLYNELSHKLSNGIYNKKMSLQAEQLIQFKDAFIDLSIEDQCNQLYEILHLFQCNAVLSDLSMIGGAAHAGTMLISNNINKTTEIQIINQSVTGMFESEVDLKAL